MKLKAALLFSTILAMGCASRSTRVYTQEHMAIELASPATERQLGEALLLTATAVEPRDAGAARKVRRGEMEFWMRTAQGEVTRVWPVAPAVELREGPAEPERAVARTFLFTKYPQVPGPAELTACYRSETGKGAPSVWCNRVTINLTGPVAMERDQAGLITRETAQRLALAHLGDQQTPAHAELVDGQFGLKDWLVILSAPNHSEQTAVLLNPYLGNVRRTWPVSRAATP